MQEPLFCETVRIHFCVGSCGATAVLSEQKVVGLIPTIGNFHTVGPCKTAVFACLATDVK